MDYELWKSIVSQIVAVDRNYRRRKASFAVSFLCHSREGGNDKGKVVSNQLSVISKSKKRKRMDSRFRGNDKKERC